MFKKELIPILHRLFQIMGKEKAFSNISYEASMTPKHDKDSSRKAKIKVHSLSET